MKETRITMGMPVTVEVADPNAPDRILAEVFAYFQYVDETFSTYKETSAITRINRGLLPRGAWSDDVRGVFTLAEETKRLTGGYFDIATADGSYDPSGIVKGWAIANAARILDRADVRNFYVDAGGDIQTRGTNDAGKQWSVGIKNPFNQRGIVKTVFLSGEGIATSGTYIRGGHIYNPRRMHEAVRDVVSLTVIAPDVYDADRFATAAFAMGKPGIEFVERLEGFEGYLIDRAGEAAFTSGFHRYTIPDAANH